MLPNKSLQGKGLCTYKDTACSAYGGTTAHCLRMQGTSYVSANIQNLNAGLEATRQMLKKKYAADENDLYMSTLKLGQIDEDEYFGRVLYDELVAILKNIKTEHRKDKTTSDGAMIDNLMKELEDAQKLEGSADEKKIRTALKAIGINYDKLTEDERKLIKKILYKTAILKPGTLAGNRGKHRR